MKCLREQVDHCQLADSIACRQQSCQIARERRWIARYDRDAAPINETIPAGEKLYAINPGYQPLLFYVHAPIVYLDRVEQLPPNVRYLLVRPKVHIDGELILRTNKIRGEELVLYRITR